MNYGVESISNAKVRVVACITIAILITIVNSILVLASASGMVLLLLAYMFIHKKLNFKTVLFIMVFGFMMAVIQGITIGSQAEFSLRLWVVSINFYREGIHSGILTFLKIFCSMGVVAFLIRGLNMYEFISVLRWMKVPAVFTEIMMFAVKYIYIFREEAANVIKAQKSRLGYRGFYRTVISMGSVAGIVLARAYDRSKVLAKSMQSRGYNGNT